MSKAIPEDWSAATLDRFCDVIGGGTPSRGVSEYWCGDIPWASPTEITTRTSKYISSTKESITKLGLEKSSAKILPPGSVLMTSRASIGYVAINTVPMTTNQGFQSLKCKKDSASADYMYQYITWIRPELEKMSAGSTFSEISSASVKRLHVTLPPLPEQQKIASILSSVDNVIEKTRAQIDKLKDLKAGMMQELLTKGIGHTEFKDSPVGRIPKGWSIDKLINLSINGINNGVFNDPKNVGSGYRLINVVNMYRGFGIQLDTLKRLEIDEKEFVRNKVEKGDVFFTRSSLKLEGIAYCNINLSDDDDITYDGHLMRVRPDQSRVLPKYLAYYCLSDFARVFFMQGAKHSTMTTIGQADIAPLPVLVPSMEEQIKICKVLDSIASKISTTEAKLISNQQVKKALMQDLLTGKVRVNLNESAVI